MAHQVGQRVLLAVSPAPLAAVTGEAQDLKPGANSFDGEPLVQPPASDPDRTVLPPEFGVDVIDLKMIGSAAADADAAMAKAGGP
jgi:hypothetical protein